MRFEDLAGKRVGILGVGREGQAVWRQLRKRFPDQPISLFAETKSDDGFAGQLDPALDSCEFAPFNRDRLSPFDVLVRSAGISPYREVLTELRTLGVQFTTANSLWFAENPDAKTICITGTKGKSTTAALTAHLIDCCGKRACLTGNIGRPMLDCDPDEVDWWVIELSSYQLSDLEAKPDIAVFLNLSDEHVDWHGSAEIYRADKLRLASLVGSEGLIVNASNPELLESLADNSMRSNPAEFDPVKFDPVKSDPVKPGSIIWFNGATGWRAEKDSVCFTPSNGMTPSTRVAAPVSLPGEHNMQNLAAALTVLQTIGFRIKDIASALATFTGLPHRLQWIGQVNGINYVDDSISTTPVSVTAALNALGASEIVLLLGGLDRGLAWDEFAGKLSAQMPHAIITMPDNGPIIHQAIERAIEQATKQTTKQATKQTTKQATKQATKQTGAQPPAGLHAVENLQQAVTLAQKLVPENGCVLLSPGAPSFPHFRDFEDRGNQFAQFAGIEKV